MKKSVNISVVIPTYNRSKTLLRSINSVLCQGSVVKEVIVVDDCSTDNTKAVIDGLSDSRVHYYKLKRNVGGAEARNIGVSKASCDYIAFQDSDDVWLPFKMDLIVDYINKNLDCGAIFSKFIQLSSSEAKLMPSGRYIYSKSDPYKSLLWQNHVDTPTLVVKKEIFKEAGGFTSGMPRFQDWDLALRLARVSTIKYFSEPTIVSYVTEGSITSDGRAGLEALKMIYSKHLNEIKKDRKLHADWIHRIGDSMFLQKENGARGFLFRAFLKNPMSIRYLAKFSFSLFPTNRFYLLFKR